MCTTLANEPPKSSLFGGGPVDPTQAALGSQAAIRSSVGAFAFLLYDIILTFDQEVELIWSRDWSFVKLLYFFVRYFPVLVQVPTLFMAGSHFTQRQCFIWVTLQDVASITIVLAVDYILILRVAALYHDRKRVKTLLFVSYIADICVVVVSIGLAIPSAIYDNNCVLTNIPTFITLSGAASGVFQVVLFGFTAIKFTQAVREGWGNVPIFKLLMRDGTWAFFTIFVAIVVNSGLLVGPTTAYARLLYGAIAFSSTSNIIIWR
ncbi:hypothetical protein PLICRDRAFT_37735 [Plicaturopsis crispa FD-325 SS-3]|nr:hypothetical protein PLICRDRAFT_37735 [Plicaturopsis crispa FD-325 SS-3]